MVVCPRCGSDDVHQVWYCGYRDGLIVPEYPTIDDDIWDCAACGAEFEVDVMELVSDPVELVSDPPVETVSLNGHITATSTVKGTITIEMSKEIRDAVALACLELTKKLVYQKK